MKEELEASEKRGKCLTEELSVYEHKVASLEENLNEAQQAVDKQQVTRLLYLPSFLPSSIPSTSHR